MLSEASPGESSDFGGVVNALPALVWTMHADGRCEFTNRAWREYTGQDSGDALAHGWRAAVHPHDLSALLESCSQIENSGIVHDIDARLRRFDGEYRWFVLRPAIMPKDGNGRQLWCWLGLDADEHSSTDGRLRRLFDMLPIQAGFLSAAGVTEFSNRQSLRDYDMTLEELQAWTTSGAIHPDDHPTVYERLTRLLTTGEMFDAQLRMRYKDGSYRWMHARCVPCRNAQGNVVRYFSCQIDIDALKRTEEELREALAQLSEGQRLSKTGSFTSDLRVDRHRWSDEYYRIFEIDPTTPPRVAAVRERVHEADLRVFDAEIQHGTEGRDADFTFRIVTPRGGLKYLRGVARLMEQVDGRPIFMGTVQDITESKLAEAALKAREAELAYVARAATLSTMTASLAHEVNQPIAGIMTNASTCLRMLGAEPPNLVGAAETARRTIRDANRAAEVVKRLRAMFGNKAPSIESVDLNEAAQEVIALSAGELQRGRVALQTQFAPDLPRVNGDRIQLQQVILNLLLNATDAMAAVEDQPRVLLVQTQGYEEVQLLVRDCGVGISANTAEKLFDAFYTTKPHGMGVGLAISRSIIESHAGRLWASPNDGPGATFCFSIPCKAAGMDQSAM